MQVLRQFVRFLSEHSPVVRRSSYEKLCDKQNARLEQISSNVLKAIRAQREQSNG